MSYMLAHLHNGWQVDQAILSEEDRIVVSSQKFRFKTFVYISLSFPNGIPSFCSLHSFQVIRFGHDWDPTCMKMDEVLYSIAEKVKNFAVIYLVSFPEKLLVMVVEMC